MKLEFTIDEQDFLDFQLLTASQSGRIKRKMRSAWIFLTLFFVGISILNFYYNYHSVTSSVIFGIFAVVCGLFYPRYFWWKYKKSYQTHIKDNYKNRFGETEYIEFRENVIFTKDKIGEGTINISEIDRVDETEKHFFVQIKTGVALIIPKYKITNPDEVRDKFKSLGFTVNTIVNNKWLS
ncbi:hypothetical protein M2138_000657 [Dysgonomonadaceae bacterium PH5-43]|nr:hypothetical protein [Dysgonomonadaceae bacterium PH5-43]